MTIFQVRFDAMLFRQAKKRLREKKAEVPRGPRLDVTTPFLMA